MESAASIKRVRGLALAVATGTVVASGAWLVAAPHAMPSTQNTDVLLTAGLNIDISIWGMDLFQQGNATAHSTFGNTAIAFGDGATAWSGTWDNPDGFAPTTGFGDFAFASGDGSQAVATGGTFDTATATGGATAWSGVWIGPNGGTAYIVDNHLNSASASGAGSMANAAGLSFDSASASGGATAWAGLMPPTQPDFGPTLGGSADSATASGADSGAYAGAGNNDTAWVFGDHSAATAGFGDNDFAGAFGNGTNAVATHGDNLFAPTFGTLGVAAADNVAPDASGGDLTAALQNLFDPSVWQQLFDPADFSTASTALSADLATLWSDVFGSL